MKNPLEKLSGIYIAVSPSGGEYVGSTVRFDRRWSDHKNGLRQNKHKNRILQAAWDKYGEDNIVFSILLVCSIEDLLFYEQRALDIIKPRYNICKIAGNCLGVKRTEEYKKAAAKRATGRIQSCETRAKRGASMIGRKVSEETKAKLRSQKGWKQSEAAKAKMRERKPSPESIAKMALSKTTLFIEYNGVQTSLRQACRETNRKTSGIMARIHKGMSPQAAFDKPDRIVKPKQPKKGRVGMGLGRRHTEATLAKMSDVQSKIFVQYENVKMGLLKACKLSGRNYGTIKSRISRGLDIQIAFDSSLKNLVEYMGEVMPLPDACRKSGRNYATMKDRVYKQGIPLQEAFDKPIRSLVKTSELNIEGFY